jgi:hypothetical protein
MMIVRFSAPVLLAASILMSGCKKTDKAPAAEPAAAPAAPAAPATPPAAAPATPPAAQAPAGGSVGTGPVVPGAKLAALDFPAPKFGPPKGTWEDARPIEDGLRSANFVQGDDGSMAIFISDCNLPKAKEGSEEFKPCTAAPTGKIKNYPLFAPTGISRAVKAGHVVVMVTASGTHMDKVKGPELEEYLNSVDLDEIAKL